ncbi:NAD-P-binding protein [Naematelia encephala]|uniref:NAD-P-binding protein n=1 Tax=Naematelia encephala TaxID=71784 RepID=A0A1Y2AZI2_9TREE|nr:NAD-P-binding protein [Naematelia encephala]
MGSYFSSSRFDPSRDIPSLKGKVILVTGANSGIGYQTAVYLALNGARVYVGARNEGRGLEAIKKMEDDHPSLRGENRLLPHELDLSTMTSAEKSALAFLEREKRLDVLVNNAGVGNSSYRIGPEGIEAAFVVNHLAQFVLTTTLLPLIAQTASLPDGDGRIIAVSSDAHNLVKNNPKFASVDDFNSIVAPKVKVANTFYNRTLRYGMSKLANVLFSKELQRRLLEDESTSEIISLAVNPGLVDTPATKRSLWFLYFVPKSWVFYTPLQGASASLFAAASPIVRENSALYRGAYLTSFGKISKPSQLGQDNQLARHLWATSEAVVEQTLAKAGL